jgi:hypothetical protein
MKLRLALILTLALALTGSCKEKDPGPQPFPLPDIPSMLTNSQDRQNYLATHYWKPFFAEDRVYSRDTSLIDGVSFEDFHLAMADYAALLMNASPKAGLEAQEYLMAAAEKAEMEDSESSIWENVILGCDGLFYDPNSPARNEEMYIPVVEAKIASPLTSDEQKAEAQALLPKLKLNRVGTPAADFSFTQLSGRRMRLYDVKADYTILLFSNPGCEDCRAIIDFLTGLDGIDSYIAAGNLAIVNVYPDADLAEWRRYAPQYPDNWYNGYNEALDVAGGLYNLRAIPSLYLLDRDKKVIYKDVDARFLVNYLKALAESR